MGWQPVLQVLIGLGAILTFIALVVNFIITGEDIPVAIAGILTLIFGAYLGISNVIKDLGRKNGNEDVTNGNARS